MDGCRNPDPRGPVLVIIGGGATGTLTAINLLYALAGERRPGRIVLLDRYGRHGRGTAYSTTDERHLLNVPAARMSAFPDDPRHFLRWARSVGVEITDDTYAERRLYGDYLTHTLAEARAAAPNVHLSHVTGTATAITEPEKLRVHLSAGGRIDADLVVLATGNRPPGDPVPELAGSPRYVCDPWRPHALEAPRGRVLCVGTGLTMIDVALTVTRDPATSVYAVSRHGLTPRPHRTELTPVAGKPAAYESGPRPPAGPLRLVDAIRWVRGLVRESADWRQAMDKARPYISDIWGRLPEADRAVFVRRLARYWEVHRHRMAEASERRIDALRAEGRFEVLTGRVTGAEAYRDLVEVRIGDRKLSVDWVINCTGPKENATDDPLVLRLVTTGMARPGPLGIGLDSDATGALLDASGVPHPRMFTIGPPRRGTLYESTAVPEIRVQATDLADHLAAHFHTEPVPAG